ncbi:MULTISPECIES: glycosyltransferase family 4 protein [unclassified Sphingomonas]|jgi:glycosyltransferase involved in cell wall biosynthesis|uniref:glycosyltransferase family 4 protein n=1 Tax=unclassified Sphingomonas TaxID=196159 RepID=UPI00082C796A|nr:MULTISPECIES: glycosyltransferase family 4 protein [unclassified Sphingomonas]
MKTIAFITNNGSTVGNFRGDLIRELAARGDHVLALAPDWDEPQRAVARACGAEPVDFSLDRVGLRPLRDLRDTARLWRQLDALKPDIVFGYFVKPVIYGMLAARAAGVRRRIAMIEGLGFVFTEGEGATTLKRRALRTAATTLYRLGLGAAHRVVMLNRDDARQFIDAGMVDAAKVTVLGGIGVDLDRFSAPPPVAGPPVFLMVARLLREKGVREYVRAAARVRAQAPGARFILLGGRDLNPGGLSADEIDAMVADGIVEWHGHVDNVADWIRDASVFVLPSYREGVPRSTQEAMAMARPVVTTSAVGCRETVEEGVNGFMVPPRDAEALAAAMMRFVDQPGLIPAMGAASRAMAEARFDVREINRRLIAIIDGEG